MNGQVCIFCILHVPLVGERIAPKDNFHPGVFQRERDGPIAGVNSRPGTDDDTIFLIDDFIQAFVIKLGNLNLTRLGTQFGIAGRCIPGVGFEEVIDSIFGTHLRCGAARPQIFRGPVRPAVQPPAQIVARSPQ